ncbi:MAG: hypothetical protein HFF15_02435 [Angelakisella sp.]|nr:hypothetical protein [Angelakisella sp.]
MFDCGENRLHEKVNHFRSWAKANYPEITEKNDNGEWCFCTEFDEMVSEAICFIKKNDAEKATQQIIDDLLYAIARDNECSMIMAELDRYGKWFALLCRSCLNTAYINAKWQFAEHLGGYKGDDNLQELVFEFLDTGDEYTERLALKTLAGIYPEEAEKYAVIFWNRRKYEDDEYQKIMVLHVLYQIHSPQLQFYLELAELTNYEYLKSNAAEIRKKIKPETTRQEIKCKGKEITTL